MGAPVLEPLPGAQQEAVISGCCHLESQLQTLTYLGYHRFAPFARARRAYTAVYLDSPRWLLSFKFSFLIYLKGRTAERDKSTNGCLAPPDTYNSQGRVRPMPKALNSTHASHGSGRAPSTSAATCSLPRCSDGKPTESSRAGT